MEDDGWVRVTPVAAAGQTGQEGLHRLRRRPCRVGALDRRTAVGARQLGGRQPHPRHRGQGSWRRIRRRRCGARSGGRAAGRARRIAGHLPGIREAPVSRPERVERQRTASVPRVARRHSRGGKRHRLARRSGDGHEGGLDDLSEPVVAVGSRLHHAAQPRGDGFDAHRPGGPCPRHRPARRVLRRARPRRRRPDHHRRLRPEPHRLAAAVRRADALVVGRPSPPPDHRTGARRGRQDPAADPARGTLCVPPVFGERIVDQGADQPVPSAGTARCRRHHRRLRPLRRAGPRSGLRRRRDHGQRRLPAQPVPRAAHQQAHRRLGRHAGEAAADAGRDRASHPRRGRRRLHHLLPDVDGRLRRGRAELGRNRRAGNRSRGSGRDDHQHRHRLARGAGADHRHLGAQQRVRRHQQRGRRARADSGGRVQPHQHAGSRRADPRRRQRAADLDGAPAAVRPGLGTSRRRPTRPTRSTPASPATRPAWTTRSCTRRCRAC